MTFSASRCLDFSVVYIVTCVILFMLFCIIWSSTTIVLLLPAKYITFVHFPYGSHIKRTGHNPPRGLNADRPTLLNFRDRSLKPTDRWAVDFLSLLPTLQCKGIMRNTLVVLELPPITSVFFHVCFVIYR
jgi:hypothetical protein